MKLSDFLRHLAGHAQDAAEHVARVGLAHYLEMFDGDPGESITHTLDGKEVSASRLRNHRPLGVSKSSFETEVRVVGGDDDGLEVKLARHSLRGTKLHIKMELHAGMTPEGIHRVDERRDRKGEV